MAASYHFVESPHCEESDVLRWFRQLPQPPEEPVIDRGVALYFRPLGPLGDRDSSPVVIFAKPQVRRGVLWTVGSVEFVAKNLRSVSPELERIRKAFRAWIKSAPLIYENRKGVENPHAYYLEGSAKNWATEILALPTGLSALGAGQYFVSERDNEFVLDQVCQTLRLRGVECDVQSSS